jgi:hypothetical protein
MKLALFMNVCEGEYEIGLSAFQSLIRSCQGHELLFFVLDDASSSRVGQRLAEQFQRLTGQATDCLELPKSLGYRGNAQRAFMGLHRIATCGENFDAVVKIDTDALVIRKDLGKFISEVCTDGLGLYSEAHAMRARDQILYLADLMPFGFKRKKLDGVIQRQWQLSRNHPVWWADLGIKALLNGFRFRFIHGSFWFIGGRTVRELEASGCLSRNQSKHGFVFNDDLLLTSAVYAIHHRVVDLSATYPQWDQFLWAGKECPLEAILSRKPYVIHPLKNNPEAWQRRQELLELTVLA